MEIMLSRFTSPNDITFTVKGALVSAPELHVIVADPGATPVTTPAFDTVATAVLLLVHVTDALLGVTMSACDVPVSRFNTFAVMVS